MCSTIAINEDGLIKFWDSLLQRVQCRDEHSNSTCKYDQSGRGAGKKVKWLDIDAKDRASLIDEIGKAKGPLAKQIKTSGIDVAMPTLNGVPLRWEAALTKTHSG